GGFGARGDGLRAAIRVVILVLVERLQASTSLGGIVGIAGVLTRPTFGPALAVRAHRVRVRCAGDALRLTISTMLDRSHELIDTGLAASRLPMRTRGETTNGGSVVCTERSSGRAAGRAFAACLGREQVCLAAVVAAQIAVRPTGLAGDHGAR